ncbi:MAG: hypothetical protein KF690_02695 [Bacteroidetes bacterium]|nr:hypothetical protein [Bacteroidota bacterium]
MSQASPPTVLQQIAVRKAQEVAGFYQQYPLEELQKTVQPGTRLFAGLVADKRARGAHFFITEFKRRSPSNPAIGLEADPAQMAKQYISHGATAISVLTDGASFGGSFADMQAVVALAAPAGVAVLNKDFVIDPIQVYLARKFGADIILLIAAILTDAQLIQLHQLALELGMDTIAEVHTAAERDRVVRLGLPVIGVNNRDLHSFRIHLNTVNVLAQGIPADRTVIAESGMTGALDFAICGAHAHGFLVGTSLMQGKAISPGEPLTNLTKKRYFFKACGLRRLVELEYPGPDLVGINLSDRSRRKADLTAFPGFPEHAVALFYENEDRAEEVLSGISFSWIQLYKPLDPMLPLARKPRILRAFTSLNTYGTSAFGADVLQSDLLILDGNQPGSGQKATYTIPPDFPVPFLLAGGIHAGNVEICTTHPMCIGVDVASGIEENNQVSARQILKIRENLDKLS